MQSWLVLILYRNYFSNSSTARNIDVLCIVRSGTYPGGSLSGMSSLNNLVTYFVNEVASIVGTYVVDAGG